MNFTPAQNAVLQKAVELLGEHFDSMLLVVTASVDNARVESDSTEIYWRGGFPVAVGHAELARHRLLNGERTHDKLPEEDESPA